MNPQPDRYERPALTIELQAPPDAMTVHGGLAVPAITPIFKRSDQGAKASRTTSAPLRLQRAGEVPDHAVLDSEPVEFPVVLGVEGSLGWGPRLSPPGGVGSTSRSR